MNKLFTSCVYLLLFTTISSQDCFQASKANWGEDSLVQKKCLFIFRIPEAESCQMQLSFGIKHKHFVLSTRNLYKSEIYIYKQMAKEKKTKFQCI